MVDLTPMPSRRVAIFCSGIHFSKALFVPSMSSYSKVTSAASVIPENFSRDLSWQFNLQRLWEKMIHGKGIYFGFLYIACYSNITHQIIMKAFMYIFYVYISVYFYYVRYIKHQYNVFLLGCRSRHCYGCRTRD